MNADMRAALATLEQSPRTMRRKVRRVAAGDDVFAEAVFTLAMGEKFTWTSKAWIAVLDRIEANDLTVAEWVKGIQT